MRIRLRAFLVLALAVMGPGSGSVSVARADTTVRGKLYRVGSGGKEMPAAGIGVRLNNSQRGPSALTYSGSDGLSYVYNVPPGKNVLEIQITKSKVLKYNIEAKNQKYTDIAPIRIE